MVSSNIGKEGVKRNKRRDPIIGGFAGSGHEVLPAVRMTGIAIIGGMRR